MDHERRDEEPTQPAHGGWLPPDTAEGPQSPQSPQRPPPGPQSPGPQSSGGPQSPADPGRAHVPQQPPAPSHPGPLGPPGQPPGGQQPPGGWATPYPAGPRSQDDQNTPAIVGLVLGIIGLVVFLFGVWIIVPLLISLPCSIAAIFVGRAGVKKVDRGESSRNRGLGQAGFITGIVGTVLSVLGVIGWVLLFVFVGEFSTSFEQGFEEGLEGSSGGTVLLFLASLALRGFGA